MSILLGYNRNTTKSIRTNVDYIVPERIKEAIETRVMTIKEAALSGEIASK